MYRLRTKQRASMRIFISVLFLLSVSLIRISPPHFQSSMSNSHKTSSLEFAASQKSSSMPKTSIAPSLPSSMKNRETQARVSEMKG